MQSGCHRRTSDPAATPPGRATSTTPRWSPSTTARCTSPFASCRSRSPAPARGYDPTPYVAGSVSTYRLFSQKYGRFEARIKSTATRVPGLQESFWLWPDDRYNNELWPAAGEIDIAETYSQYPDRAIPYLHYTENDNGGPKPGRNTAWVCTGAAAASSTPTRSSGPRPGWRSRSTAKSCLVNTSGDPAFQKPYIVALTQLLGTAGNEYDGRAPLPATTTVDYVKVWK